MEIKEDKDDNDHVKVNRLKVKIEEVKTKRDASVEEFEKSQRVKII